jgi:hypothetical protein
MGANMYTKRNVPIGLISFALLLSASISSGTPPGWSVDPGQFAYSGSITATVCEGTQQIAASGDILGAFVGGECRGVIGSTGALFFLAVYGNTPANEVLHFRFYDASLDLIREVTEVVAFAPDMLLGSPSNPLLFHVGAIASISVLVPNGGEVWCTGVPQRIQWTTQGQVANVNIELSRSGFGGPWETLLAGTPSDGEEQVTVTGSGSTSCVIRISDCENAAISDMSNSLFTVRSDCGPGWRVDPLQFAYTGSITATVLDGMQNIVAAGDTLGAFVGTECRGVAWPSGVVLFLAVYSNQSAGETLTFRYYDASLHLARDVTETLPFTPDMLVGTPSVPYQMHTAVTTDAPEATEDMLQRVRVYPNPAHDRVFMLCRGAEGGSWELNIVDAAGRRVRRVCGTGPRDGLLLLAWDGRTDGGVQAPTGTYLGLLTSGLNRQTVRITLLR